MPAREEMPSTLQRSPKRAQEIWAEAHDSAVETYGEGERAHRIARKLRDEAQRGLYDQMRRVLRASVRAERVPPRRNWLTGIRDTRHGRCPRCHTVLCRDRSAAAARSGAHDASRSEPSQLGFADRAGQAP